MDSIPSSKKLDLQRLAEPGDLKDVIPVSFSYNYLPRLPRFLKMVPWSFDIPLNKNREQFDPTWANSFPIYPSAAGLPYHSSLPYVRQSRHWRRALREAAEMYELLATDKGYNDVKLGRGGTLATVAQRELDKPEFERFVTPAINLFAQGDEERLSLIACGIILVTTFDDTWEKAKAGEELRHIQEDFVARMKGQKLEDEENVTPLQLRLNEIIQRCRACDQSTNTDGGQDFINCMLEWITHDQPEGNFKTPREYLDYRWHDAANMWLAASCKFSIASSISLYDPILHKITRLIGDHESIVNDLASFDKELTDFRSGKTVVLINLVQVMRDACGLSVDEAKAAAFTLQLLTEQQIQNELEVLKEMGSEVTLEHWRYIDALLAMIAGNNFYVVTTSRYGREAARIT